ncbi:MAG: hypothetical protein AAFW84_04865 [Cyanobacteria bacterium J06635_15]
MAQQSQVSDELKAAFELALKNRGISRAMNKWNLPAQVVGASLVVSWPLGAALGQLFSPYIGRLEVLYLLSPPS